MSTAPPVVTRKGKEKAVIQDEQVGEDQADQTASDMNVKTLRRNPVGVQLLSDSLHRQLFPGESFVKPPDRLLEISKNHLKDNGLSPEGAAVLSEIDFKMPPLRGRNIRDHFHALGEHTAEPYLSMAKEFMWTELPLMPKRWEVNKPGWTKYHLDGRTEEVEDLEDERIVSFDVETLYKLSPFPVMATAVTPNGWYSWLSPTIFEDPPAAQLESQPPWTTRTPSHHPHDLIPLFKGSTPRVVIGHNVGYDRARVKEEYSLERTSTRWLDTLSLHVATRGITSVQRPAWMAHRKNKRAKALREQESLLAFQELAEENGDSEMLEGLQDWGVSGETETEALQNQWQDVTSVNSLAEVAALHCGIPVDKSIRNRFGDEQITHASQLRNELHDLLTYCGGDVRITHEVYKKVLPLFLESCPHPASFSGVLSMGNSFLPVGENWEEYLKNAESKYREMDEGVKKALRVLAEKVRAEGLKETDPWSSQLDWSPKSARWANNAQSGVIPASDLSSQQRSTLSTSSALRESPTAAAVSTMPAWLVPFEAERSLLASTHTQRYSLPLLLRMSYKGHPVAYLADHHWCFVVPHDQLTEYIEAHGAPVELNHKKDKKLEPLEDTYAFFRIGRPGEARKSKLSGPSIKTLINKGELTSPHQDLLNAVAKGKIEVLIEEIWQCAQQLNLIGEGSIWGQQLDWTPKPIGDLALESHSSPSSVSDPGPVVSSTSRTTSKNKSRASKAGLGTWPKWYWDLTGPPTRIPPGELDLTFKKTVAPLLLRLQWQGYPLIHSRAHKWLYRVPRDIIDNGGKDALQARGGRVKFDDRSGDDAVYADDKHHYYFRLPHKDGEGKNVGNPLSKHFVKSIESGELASAAAESGDDVAAKAATDATNMNAFCSYWISARERIMNQMVVYQSPTSGMILPQVITMGTVTRRAVEATWLTASNAKKNRVGSELKAMVRAPHGYAIVGADVDSEELWISSVMGDSQFGMHGATAIGWMTLEGTKSAGTDLHSKTANILGISRDAAKVFNYSRIYGAGKKHAVQLLLQGDSKLTKETAGKLADNLYKATKGAKTIRSKDRAPAAIPSIWHGGSESYLFNTLEAIALSDRPTTPALGCGITKALRKSYLEEGSSYLPSRVNWVVQSSGVDYLHLLIVSMEYLLAKYKIDARYLISVHDEVRYLAKEEDKYRTALALQIANAWTRALFCYNLGMDDMPQGIAFFSAVDVDHVLRKEVFMTCETPSHPTSIHAGESLDIDQLLAKTGGGKLGKPIKDDLDHYNPPLVNRQPVSLFPDIQSSEHRLFLEAQAAKMGKLAKVYLDGLPEVVDSVEEAEKRGYKPSVRKAVAFAKGA
ncbi:DNA polymerase gamma 1 [Kwoniella heveanensis BCC8398]|uniref:Mitochondrial DNA polymerase catalytic subunit n=1 Tax=Kwoniella heveanensis BCC8398 TaxID=1296120 RepID=A0A1B9GK83_9TREE|nr:DNA polymerase gamma 1 [Kwoniella heveanensis BCC8398]